MNSGKGNTIFDIEMIRAFYGSMNSRIAEVRKNIGHPLTLSEKIIYTHLLYNDKIIRYGRKSGYALFRPDRLAMQDATAQMTLLQFMMTSKDRSAIPASVHCDHLITAVSGADPDLKEALANNREVYDFLSSACRKYGISFWKPGAGIIHQIVLENYAFPGGMIIGTDSHTPNAGGLGMIAIGVGGADAVDVMTGSPWELMFPGIIGIRLTGRLSKWVSAKDIILKITEMLTVSGGTGSVLEYFGDGAESLSCTGKATICNMGAETGATCSLFGFDRSMADYLTATGRKEIADLAVQNSRHLTADPEVYASPDKYFDTVIEIDLSKLEPYINGPYTPDLSTPVRQMKVTVREKNWPENAEVVLIGSCTNSSFEDLSGAASVVRDALSKKLSLKSRLMIIPGSQQTRSLAEKKSYMDLFRKAGAEIYASACGPCIGQWERRDDNRNRINTVIHTFNRNFSKRTDGNPNTHVFVTSPVTAAAIAFSGKLTFCPESDSLVNEDGLSVMLDIPEQSAIPHEVFPEELKSDLVCTEYDCGTEILILPDSDRLQLLTPFEKWEGNDLYDLPLLIKVKGKCTTDHISMAGPWLKYRGHLENISGNYMIGAVNYFNRQVNSVLNQITGEYNDVPYVAGLYRDSGTGSVVVGEDNFGEGSSREHAAMEPRYLGVRAVIVKSFARIHETNLKKQGVLTLTFRNKGDYERIRENDVIDITGLREFSPGSLITVILNHADGTKEEFSVSHSYNDLQISWFRAGGAINFFRNENSVV
jgi:aconitate hydratase